ncbi:MAG: BMP family ABC transporter substrate-binding protein [Betaproteobacteria bacterium]|jgi:simple sugar transport system substrate-binding protein|nr:BMP family ABC transporter substrate-binding protein [Betaproteobacteria bacterium]
MTTRRQFIQASVAGGTLTSLGVPALAQSSGPLKIGFVYVSPIGDAGWTTQHNMGRLEMEKALAGKVTTSFVEKVSEGADTERVIREMATSGHRLIFATSFGYMNAVEKVSKEFPKVAFMHATGYKSGPNFGNYNARFYEGRYIAGMVAGRTTKSNVLGYVAAFPIPEVLQGINSFTRGARSVNPKIDVRVIWVNSWYDPGKEREAALTLIAQKADVLTHHTDSTAVVQAAEEKAVFACGYHSDMSKYGPKAHLTATTHHWGAYYTKIAQEVIAGTWKAGTIWGGMKDGFIKMAPLNASIPAAVKDQVTKVEADIRAGKFHPFSGSVMDQDGKERLGAGKTMSDDELGKMNYYVQGVTSKLPKS